MGTQPRPGSQRGRRGRATIQAVADAAGVSLATVSRVMSGNTTVRADLAERVRAAARDLEYRPSALAQGLARGNSCTVGVVVPNLANPYFGEFLKAMALSATADGFQLLIADSNEDPVGERALVDNLLRHVDALVLASSRMSNGQLRELAAIPQPIVLVNRIPVGIGLPAVAIDNYSAVLDLCGHLANLGHRRVVYLGGPESSWQESERWRAVQQASAFGLHVIRTPAGATIAEGSAATDAALAHDPTALMCFNDLVAFGVLSRLRELGLEVPRDVSLTGFDDIAFDKYADPPLTTAASPQRDLGQRAWELVTSLLRAEPYEGSALLPAPLIVRQSTAPPRS